MKFNIDIFAAVRTLNLVILMCGFLSFASSLFSSYLILYYLVIKFYSGVSYFEIFM
jgi:hypothetical protein